MFSIENRTLQVTIASRGAELSGVLHKGTNLQYLWSADPAYWAKKSPVLFPIVGTLKDDTYYHNGVAYHLPRHGFARDMEFSVLEHTTEAITFFISSNAETLTKYPFHFEFHIRYVLSGNSLSVTYSVYNKGRETMLFSVGGHPAFKVPLTANTTYEDYSLQFNEKETAGRWPVGEKGLLQKAPETLLNNTHTLPLTKELFKNDALVFKNLQSTSVQLKCTQHAHGLVFHFSGFPYLGIWAAPGADFVCIEPWCGITDSVDTDQQLAHKEGIITLPAGDAFDKTWRVDFY